MLNHSKLLTTYNYRTLWYTVAVALLTLLLYLSFSPSPPETPITFENADKLFHFTYYLVMSFWYQQLINPRYKTHLFIFLVGLGIVIEFLQPLGGHRFFELFDMLANTLGVLLGLFISLKIIPTFLFKVDYFLSSLRSPQTPE